MGWFAYSLQEVLSYLILSPRCLYDGSKVAYGGREWITAHTLLSMRYYPCAIIHALLSMPHLGRNRPDMPLRFRLDGLCLT